MVADELPQEYCGGSGVRERSRIYPRQESRPVVGNAGVEECEDAVYGDEDCLEEIVYDDAMEESVVDDMIVFDEE